MTQNIAVSKCYRQTNISEPLNYNLAMMFNTLKLKNMYSCGFHRMSYIAGESDTEVSFYVFLSWMIFADVLHNAHSISERHARVRPILDTHLLQTHIVITMEDLIKPQLCVPFHSLLVQSAL